MILSITDTLESFYELVKGLFDFLSNLPTFIMNVFGFMKVVYIELPAFILSFFGHFPSFVQSGFTIVFNILLLVMVLRFITLVIGVKG